MLTSLGRLDADGLSLMVTSEVADRTSSQVGALRLRMADMVAFSTLRLFFPNRGNGFSTDQEHVVRVLEGVLRDTAKSEAG